MIQIEGVTSLIRLSAFPGFRFALPRLRVLLLPHLFMTPITNRAMCAWTASIKAIWMASKVSITPMLWTVSPSDAGRVPPPCDFAHRGFSVVQNWSSGKSQVVLFKQSKSRNGCLHWYTIRPRQIRKSCFLGRFIVLTAVHAAISMTSSPCDVYHRVVH